MYYTMPDKKKSFKRLTSALQTVSEPNRLHILCLLFQQEKMCVSDISRKLKISIAVASHHLQSLTKEGLIESQREGKKICYFLSPTDFMQDFKNLICKYKNF